MLPWAEMMRAALAAGIPIDAFWHLSLREWRWLAGGAGDGGLGAKALQTMMAEFPDKDEK